MTKKILLIFTIFFWAGMLFLTFFAEQIHIAALPKVTALRPEQKLFPYEHTDANGDTQTGSMQKIAVPRSLLEGDVFIVYSAEKNGTRRSFVRLAPIQTGEERDGYVEVVSGITFADRIVYQHSGELFDGCEVNIV